MKKAFMIILLLTAVVFSGNKGYSQEKKDNWPELTAFHKVMSQTFHPSEDGNLKPIKERSGEMLEKANALAKSKIPAENNKKDVIEAVKKLQKDSESLDKLVKSKASDKEITKALSDLHDTFHMIVEKCEDSKEKH